MAGQRANMPRPELRFEVRSSIQKVQLSKSTENPHCKRHNFEQGGSIHFHHPVCRLRHRLSLVLRRAQAAPPGPTDLAATAPDLFGYLHRYLLPFQLNPYAASADKRQFYSEKFGADRVALIHERLNAVGQQVGINFKFGGRIGNTRDSHRLVHLSKKYGQETHLKAVDGLFAAYFENEGDIMDAAVLKQVATGAGIPEADFQRAIVDSDEGGAEVDQQAGSARASGVSGVPDFTIQDRFHLSGSRDATEFVAVFEKVKALEVE
ncbi:hypothetical protein PT974_04596 [Cladobotryum mycophilum]|uniref:DSBA-like thioredoxin domain-containing protein n=1 Tax=Cladobotryum mycophilum TaxID=491253 RepID=A0ABR0SVK6_9HYPO